MVEHLLVLRRLAAYLLFPLLLIPAASLLAHEAGNSKIDRLTHEIEKTPTHAMLYLQRGDEYQAQFMWDEALADYQRVAQLKPDYPLIAYYRGSLFYASGRFEQAEKELNNYLGNAPDDVQGLILRARILRKLHQIDRAQVDYSQAILMSSQIDASLYVERAELLIDGGDRYFALALSGLDEGMRKLGSLILFELTAIDINLKQENYTAAIERIDIVLSRISRKEKWLVRRAEVLQQAGRFTEARTAYMNALEAIELLPERQSKTPALALLRQRIDTQIKNLE